MLAATAEGETSVAGETQNVSTGTGTAAANDDEVQDSTAATDDEIQGGTTATGGEAQDGDTAATADSEMPATGETQTDTATESAAATAPQIPALMTEVTDSVYEAYAQKSDAFTGKLAGHDRLSRAENARWRQFFHRRSTVIRRFVCRTWRSMTATQMKACC